MLGGRSVGAALLTVHALIDVGVSRVAVQHGPVDIWAVDDVDPNDLIDSGNGFSYVPYRINRARLTLHDQGLTEDALPPAVEIHNNTTGSSTAYSSSLTIALDDGTVLHGDAAHAYVDQRVDGQ